MKRPNFLFIMTDTQATNMVGCYSGKPLNTQNIDSLAAEGIRFNSAYTCSPVCTPARAGLFTGIYANQSGPWTNNVAPGKNISTMGRYFKDAGYHTCYIGKWHLDGHDYFGTGECPPEWDADYWFDGANYLSELTEKEISLWRNGLNSVEDLQANHIDETFTWAHRISNRAVDFLQQPARADEPFLMVISYDEPHHPFTCPVEYLEKYTDFYYELGEKAEDDLANKPEHHRLWAQAMPSPVGDDGLYHHPLYFACNDFVDDQIGRVINALTPEQRENTWVIYTSDHGEMMGAHKLMKLFMQQKKSLAVVVDEFGGTSGIVALEDLVEEIFGEIEDEHDTTSYIAKEIGDNEYILSGRLEIEKANELFSLDLPESDEYQTVGGLILHHYQSFPKMHEVIKFDNFQFKIIKVTATKIELVKLKVTE